MDDTLNSCDKCNDVLDTDNLIWITSEDFQPNEGEVVPDEAFEKYDALCLDCYLKIVQPTINHN